MLSETTHARVHAGLALLRCTPKYASFLEPPRPFGQSTDFQFFHSPARAVFTSSRVFIVVALAICAALFACGCGAGNPRVLIQTELGDITVEIYERNAPVTAPNFLRYIKEGRFEGATFYRTVTMSNQPDNDVKIEVIQGGLGDDEQGLGLPPIQHETTVETGLRHRDGTISMARAEPGTASSEFFICIGNQPELDFGGKRNPDGQGFAAFGRVVEGMDVVRQIQQRPADGQWLSPEIRITRVRLLDT